MIGIQQIYLMLQIHRIFKNQNVADICEKEYFYYPYPSFVTAVFIIIFFSRNAGIFFSFCLSSKYPFLCSPRFSFHVQFSVFFCSNYLDDVAQFNSKGLISSSLSSFPTTITDHVFFLFFFLSYFQNKQL